MNASGKIWYGLQILLNAKKWPTNEESCRHSCNVKILSSTTLMTETTD